MDEEHVLRKIDQWAREGLISPAQAEALKDREAAGEPGAAPDRRVKADEILVYLGSLVVFLALAFLVGLNWEALGITGRILSVLVPTLVMLALGGWLHRSESARLRRGAQALLLGGCLLSGLTFGVIFSELDLIDDEALLGLASSLLATVVAAGAFAWVRSVAQSVALHLGGSVVLATFNAWLEPFFRSEDHIYRLLVAIATCVVVGSLWLGLSRGRWIKAQRGLVTVARIFGTLTILGGTFFSAVAYYHPTAAWHWHQVVLELIAFLTTIAFIAASVRWQSQVYLYGGAAFLLAVITYVNFEHFADKIGMPVALFIAGVLLIGLGLGTERLSRSIRASA
jgi:hypothetical protein